MRDRINLLLLSLAIIVFIAVAVFIPIQEASAEQAGSFIGTWIASGKRQPLDFVEGREVFIFKLAGHINLKNEIGEIRDFWSECVGLWDSRTGSTARCVWRGLEGQEAYLVISGQLLKEDSRQTGEFVGGTGNLKGLEGAFTFTWSSVFRNRNEGIVTGHSKDLTGSYRIP